MGNEYYLGLKINRAKESILNVLIEDFQQIKREQADYIGMDSFAIRQYAQLDVSKLFLAFISNKPSVFKNYVLWQSAVFSNNNVAANRIRKHMNVFRKTLKSHIENKYHDRIDEYFDHAMEALESALPAEHSYLGIETADQERAEKYLQLLLDKKQNEAMHYIGSLAYNKIKNVKAIYKSVIVPVQYEIGRLWQSGEISVADEHFATETTKSVISSLRTMYSRKNHKGKVITLAVGGEMHDMGIRVINEFLLMDGYEVLFLGTNTPMQSILDFARKNSVDAIALSITTTNYLWWTKRLIQGIRALQEVNARIIVGGLAFIETPEAWKTLGADAYGEDADSAVKLLNDITRHQEATS